MIKRILRRPEVEEVTGLAPSTIYWKIKRDEFPRPIRLGANSVGWLESEISSWQESRIAERDGDKAAA
jgi:prophage regulatory protein